MDGIYVYEIVVYRFNTQELVEKFHILADGLFRAHHIAVDIIFDDEFPRYKNIPVEIASVSRVYLVGEIINPEFVLEQMEEEESQNTYDGTLPIQVAKNMIDSEVMEFNCPTCQDPVRVPQEMLFPFVRCETCKTDLFRKNIHNFGGKYIYEDDNKDGRKK